MTDGHVALARLTRPGTVGIVRRFLSIAPEIRTSFSDFSGAKHQLLTVQLMSKSDPRIIVRVPLIGPIDRVRCPSKHIGFFVEGTALGTNALSLM